MSTSTRSSLYGPSLSSTVLLGGLLLAVVGVALAIGLGEARMAVSGVALFLLLAMSMVDIRLSILGLFTLLTLLGDVRRLLIPLVGWSGADPILMVGPVFTVLLLGYAIIAKRISLRSTLSRLMLGFSAILVLQIFNPNQGELAVGVVGAILVLGPTLWFWIGQAFGSERFLKTFFFSVVVPLSVVALAMGFVQLAYGYLPYQLEWYRVAGYTALGDTESTLRPISIFPNITEYLLFVSIAVVALFAALLHRSSSTWLKQLALFLVPAGLAALLLAGSRGPLVMTIIVMVFMWAVKGRSVAAWVPRLAIAGLLAVVGFVWSLDHVSTLGGSERIQANLDRQVQLIETGGTANIHANLAWMGIYHGLVEEPFGMGVGSITLAVDKFDGTGFNSEKDLTNMFIATGAFGGFVYLFLVGTVAFTAIRYWVRSRSMIALVIFGVLATTGLAWLVPGHYLITPLVWFVIGVLDRLHSRPPAPAAA